MKLLTTAAILAALTAPAAAADSAITIWNTLNPGGAESANGTGSASVLSSNLGGVTVSVSSVQKGTNPNDLTEANISIDNTTGTIQTLKIIAGANGYLGPSDVFHADRRDQGALTLGVIRTSRASSSPIRATLSTAIRA